MRLVKTHDTTLLDDTMQYNTVKCSAVQFNTVQCSASQCDTMRYSTMLCNAMQYSAMQCCTKRGLGMIDRHSFFEDEYVACMKRARHSHSCFNSDIILVCDCSLVICSCLKRNCLCFCFSLMSSDIVSNITKLNRSFYTAQSEWSATLLSRV